MSCSQAAATRSSGNDSVVATHPARWATDRTCRQRRGNASASLGSARTAASSPPTTTLTAPSTLSQGLVGRGRACPSPPLRWSEQAAARAGRPLRGLQVMSNFRTTRTTGVERVQETLFSSHCTATAPMAPRVPGRQLLKAAAGGPSRDRVGGPSDLARTGQCPGAVARRLQGRCMRHEW